MGGSFLRRLLRLAQDGLHLDTLQLSQPAGQSPEFVGGSFDDEADDVEISAVPVAVVQGNPLPGQDEVVEIAHDAVELLDTVAVFEDQGDNAESLFHRVSFRNRGEPSAYGRRFTMVLSLERRISGPEMPLM